ncbi:hypothetical protein OAE48_03545 [Flavobacteriales bacterium]|nr:hypothetical protein [Flavobacteriales bacterium]
MRSIRNSVLIILLYACNWSFAQTEVDTILPTDNVMIPLPTVSLNFGFNHLMSDVKLSQEGPSPFRQFGYQLSITQRAARFLNVTLELYTGNVYGEEQRGQTNINFRTTLFSQHLNLEYNFYPLLKPDSRGRQLIQPYVGVGVGAIFFRSKGDLKNESGTAYQYWSDGLIYAESEGSIPQTEATALTRDFEYETDLRDANLDGLRKYPQTAFSLPLNAGIRFQISKNVGVNAAFAYALNFSDMLDNVSENGSGDRLGSAGNDNHLFGSIGLSVFLGTTKPSSKPKKPEVEVLAENKAGSENPETTSQSEESAKSLKESDEILSIDEIKKKTTSEVIKQASSPTLMSVKKAELEQSRLDGLNSVATDFASASATANEILTTAKEKSGKASNELRKSLSSVINAQTASLTEIKESSQNYINENEASQEASSDEKSVFVETIEATLEQLNTSKKGASKAKSNEDVVAIAQSLLEINQATAKTIQTERESQQLKTNTEKLSALEDKVSLYEFVKDSEDLSAEDESALDELKQKLTEEFEKLVVLGAITEAKQNTIRETLSTDSELASITDVEVSANNAENQRTQSTVLEQNVDSQSSETITGAANSKKESEIKSFSDSNNPESSNKKTPTIEEIENTPPKVSGGYHWADLNSNGWISPDEVLHFIDLLFEGEAVRTVEDIQNLIDYYFDQE